MSDYIDFDNPEVDKQLQSLMNDKDEEAKKKEKLALQGLLRLLSSEYTKAQYRISSKGSTAVAGFTDYYIDLRYTNELGTFTDSFAITAVKRHKS